MADSRPVEPGPAPDEFAGVFDVYERRQNDDRLLYFGQLRAPREVALRRVWPLFRERGYEATLTRRRGEDVLVAEPIDTSVDGFPWTNVVLFVATVLSTLYAGTAWYYVQDPIANPIDALRAWPFAAAVLGILGVHELGHYVMSRYHDVEATLPYFIPLPTIFGTMGAFIKLKGHMPDRRALFDIGVAGPLAGLAATVVVTAIGLSLPPIDVPAWVYASPNTYEIEFGKPLLFLGIAAAMGVEPVYRNPVVIGAWVGMFVTFLNLLPVGQLDGGHIVRALVGDRQRTVSALVVGAIFAFAGYLFYFEHAGNAVGIWVFWGLFTLGVAFVGPAQPMREDGLDTRRKLLGLLTLVFGVLCFTPMPIQILT